MPNLIRRCLAALSALVVLALALPAAAAPALWVIRDADSTIYLFGSVHYLRPGLNWRSPAIDKALADSRDLTLEVPDLDNPALMAPLVQTYGLDPAHPLSSKIHPKDGPRLTAAAQAMGLPRPALEP